MELTGGKNRAPRLITNDLKFERNANLVDAANRVRTYLGISLATQQSWQDDETTLKAWREALQAVGIFIFKDAFKVEEFSGFCLFDEVFPVIYVNNSTAKTRQVFTLFHELASAPSVQYKRHRHAARRLHRPASRRLQKRGSFLQSLRS
jgi:IrrE N-terminal-like domain